MMYLTLQPFRVAIDTSIINDAAKNILTESSTIEGLEHTLGYTEEQPMPEEIGAGFHSQKNPKQLLDLLQRNQKRTNKRKKRIAKGFPDFIARKGIKGWIQKTFYDKGELALPIEYEIIDWVHNSPRYNLLITLHDMILNSVASGEPKEIELSEISSYPNPITEMITYHDKNRAQKLIQALSVPINKIQPETLIEDLAGYVTYHRTRGFAYYYASNE